jgi:TolB protein
VTSNRSGSFGLYQIRSDSPDTLLPIPLDGGATQAVRSPDRTRIAYSSTKGGSAEIYIADADGRNPRRLTSDSGAETQPTWTPDGARLVYTATPTGGVAQIMSVKVDGTDPRPLTSSTTGGNTAPDVSPDGRRVAFVSTRDGNPEIYEVAIEGREARRLTKTGDKEGSPRYLPSGDLLYVLDKGSKARLMRLASGSSAAPLPVLEIDQPVVALDVSPDGERVAYVAGKLAEAGKGKSQLSLRIQPLAPRSTPVLVPLHPGEQVLSPSF